MMTPQDEDAAELVADLSRLGARLQVTEGGPFLWWWTPRKEVDRARILQRLEAIDLTAPGLPMAIVKAIRNRQQKGSH